LLVRRGTCQGRDAHQESGGPRYLLAVNCKRAIDRRL
jgi:hypothetical protein